MRRRQKSSGSGGIAVVALLLIAGGGVCTMRSAEKVQPTEPGPTARSPQRDLSARLSAPPAPSGTALASAEPTAEPISEEPRAEGNSTEIATAKDAPPQAPPAKSTAILMEEIKGLTQAKRTAELIAAREAAAVKVRRSTAYRQLYAEFSALQSRVNSLRASDPAAELPAASRRLMDAKSRIAKLERDHVQKDPAVRTAELMLKQSQ